MTGKCPFQVKVKECVIVEMVLFLVKSETRGQNDAERAI